MNAQLYYISPPNFAYMMDGSKKWLDRLDRIIESDLGASTLNNEQIAKDLAISERQLFRKMKALTGLSPQKYLRQIRLQTAMKFLRTGRYRTVKETSYAVGYSNVSYFITQFELEYGVKPLQVLQEEGWR